MGRATGEEIDFPPLDGGVLLAEAKIEYQACGMAGSLLLLLAATLMSILLLVLLLMLGLTNAVAGFLGRHQDQVKDQQAGVKRPSTTGPSCCSFC